MVAVYLFGSAARESSERLARDLDLAMVFDTDCADPFREALRIQAELELTLGFPVDVHDFDALPVDLRFRVLSEGRVLVERDPIRRVRREVRAMLEYYDFKPYLERIRTATLRRLEHGTEHA
ncbi:MAG: nucleotidyltransferase domain-containing protein [Deltaproteobacteria bacterium]|nr:nucleotidyltransferase domain-containing protein [Deltaproteobacteria bacterium]